MTEGGKMTNIAKISWKTKQNVKIFWKKFKEISCIMQLGELKNFIIKNNK